VSNSAFVVPLADLERGPKSVQWTISTDWLRQALAGTDATPNRAGELEVELTKSGRDVVVRGRVRAEVTMPCSRTLDPVQIPIDAELFLMLAQADPPATAQRPRGRRRAEREATPGKRGGPGAAKRGKGGWEADPTLTETDAARDTFVGEQVALDPFVREFILLELPMFPLRSDLPSDAPAAIAPASPSLENAPNGGDGPGAQPRRIDPRLAPLAEIKARLKSDKE
jgi:uncharacterized protein